MANMSYCRFENTYRDLVDCAQAMNETLSENERKYKEKLVNVCQEIIEEYELNKMSDSVWGDDEWGFDIVELERGEEDKDNNNDDIPWDTQTR